MVHITSSVDISPVIKSPVTWYFNCERRMCEIYFWTWYGNISVTGHVLLWNEPCICGRQVNKGLCENVVHWGKVFKTYRADRMFCVLKLFWEYGFFRYLAEDEWMPEAVEWGWKIELVDVLLDFNNLHINFSHPYRSTVWCSKLYFDVWQNKT